MRNFCLTCGKFAPEPGFYVYSGPVCQCLNPSLGRQLVDALKEANQAQKPDDWTHAKAQMDHEMGVKPDASQREWPIKYVRTCDMHDRPITRDKMPMISVGAVNWLKDQLRTAHAERDALAKRVAELEKTFERSVARRIRCVRHWI